MSMHFKHVIGLAAVLGLSAMSHAAMTDELPGNLFHQSGAPAEPNVSIAVNYPQNMSGGGQIIGTYNVHGYPVGDGNSPILDGDVTTGWDSGTFSGGGMANIGLTQGYYKNAGGFSNVPFSAIGTIRIWAGEYINDDQSYWQKFPQQLKIAYTTNSFSPGDGYTYNSNTLGQTPNSWNQTAIISSLNGTSPTAPANTAYDTNDGWVNLSGLYTTTPSNNHRLTYGYVDVAVNIPAGATSILLSFGQVNSSTGNPGGMNLRDVQAVAVPEPASLGVLGLAGVGLLARRRRSV